MSANESTFKFRRQDTVGAIDAKHDLFLNDCFVDNGEIDELTDPKSRKRIIVGRTGAGKTALLLWLENNLDNVKRIDPVRLSLNHLASSTVLSELSIMGVDLGLFYRTLWKHVFVCEIIKSHWHIKDEKTNQNAWNTLCSLLNWTGKSQRYATRYIQQFGGQFWITAEEQTRKLVERLEDELRSTMGVPAGIPISLSVTAGQTKTSETQRDIKMRGQQIVDSAQMGELSEIISIVKSETGKNRQRVLLFVVDSLDDDWVSPNYKNEIILSLIQAIDDLSEVKNVKIIICLRNDLLERVLLSDKNKTIQREKVRDICIPLVWSSDSLRLMLGKRINALIKRRYTRAEIEPDEIFSFGKSGKGKNKQKRSTPTSYLIDRTLYHPRDLIRFFNLCIEFSDGKPDITKQAVHEAERIYSKERLDNLADEWKSDYPMLSEFTTCLLKGLPKSFTIDIVLNKKSVIVDSMTGLYTSNYNMDSPLIDLSRKIAETNSDFCEYVFESMKIMYLVGCVGVKLSAQDKVVWSFHPHSPVAPHLDNDTKYEICPAFYRVLGLETGVS